MTAALDGIRVLDMSRILAGPWAGQLLGDYGADVVKVERPLCGDDTRQWGPPWLDGQEGGESAYFLSANRNKRSLTIDLASLQGRELLTALACKADVLLENYKVGTMAGFGLGPEQLLKANPRLIYCSVSSFGQSGPHAAEPGYDAMIQSSAGLMSITGPPPDQPGGPQKVGVAIADIMAGMYATTAVLAALNSRTQSGQGQHIDVPLYDSQVAWLANQSMNYLVGGEVPARMGTAHPNLVPYQAFKTADGEFMLAVGNDQQFARCCSVLDLDKLSVDARFSSSKARIQNREALIPHLQQRLLEKPTAAWLSLLGAAAVPAGPINDIAEVLGNEHARERKLVRESRNSDGRRVPLVANPVLFEQSPVEHYRAPPLLGEHKHEVLSDWLGYSAQQIASLEDAGVI
ncbi:MAG: CoA transferase [Gammaproteobacteria bacterium]|nr:CoA transferase [Gammaproteobacteria bacterium]